MGQVKPLVNYGGIIKNIQANDFLAEVNLPTAVNANIGTVIAGSPIYHTTTTGSIDLARANAIGTTDCCGLVVANIGTGASGQYQDSGSLTLTTTQWDSVTGQTGGLTIGSTYFLDSTLAGKMTTTPPSSVGEFTQVIGKAVSTTEFHIKIGTFYGL